MAETMVETMAKTMAGRMAAVKVALKVALLVLKTANLMAAYLARKLVGYLDSSTVDW